MKDSRGFHWYISSICWDAYYGCSICPLLFLHVQDTQLILLREVGELGEFGLHLRRMRKAQWSDQSMEILGPLSMAENSVANWGEIFPPNKWSCYGPLSL